MTKQKSPYAHLTNNYGKIPESQNETLQQLTKHHVDSFDHFINNGLADALQSIPPLEFQLPNEDRIRFKVQDGHIAQPRVDDGNQFANDMRVYPKECRERGITYGGQMTMYMEWFVNGKSQGFFEQKMGAIPIMVKSIGCNLHGLSPKELVQHGEEAEEMGGYFIVNGNDKLIRTIVQVRRHYPIGMTRGSWKTWGAQFSEYGVMYRSVKADQSSDTCILHYIHNGSAVMSFNYNKERFFMPILLVLKSLCDVTDQYIYTQATKGYEDDTFFTGCMTSMLRQAQKENLNTQKDMLQLIGEKFRVKLDLPEWYSDQKVAKYLLNNFIMGHMNNREKFDTLVYMIQKLFDVARHKVALESLDNPVFQEVLLGGHLYLNIVKEDVSRWLNGVKAIIHKLATTVSGTSYQLTEKHLAQAARLCRPIVKTLESFLATGNLLSRSGLDQMQVGGYCIVADKLNFVRYVSHFRSIHRGSYFTEMRTTTVRKLLPEAWGFLCPVHTPDGTPCGLLNHISGACQVVNQFYKTEKMFGTMYTFGMLPNDEKPLCKYSNTYIVMCDGKLVGRVYDEEAQEFTDKLRAYKVKQLGGVPSMLEICFTPKTSVSSQIPGIYLFTTPARMMRPVYNLAHKAIEYIGSMEQVYLNICVNASEAHEHTTHQELRDDIMLSAVASLTPFSDFNQSPRNMYQCQMGKQTMGTPLHALPYRADNKLYRVLTPQSPMVRPVIYDDYAMDNYPAGTNAVVAVISYTGYDMEDAMILNKSSYERGFCAGMIYKSEVIDLGELSNQKNKVLYLFGASVNDKCVQEGKLDTDGLPPIGTILDFKSPLYSYINIQTSERKLIVYKSKERAIVEQIKILGHNKGTEPLQKICIIYRIQRNPVIGDKFASRHGQKGICSQKWPVEDMPFTESGMVPDIIFNPHGFPSRMTIGMMIESMGGKSAALHGIRHDATPFTFSEDNSAIDYMGKMLTASGYNYYGTERMYSGVDGREMEADIFIGVVYYQRLRHMVSDKFQVRSTGAIDQITHQPVKGRQKGGGVRFGEMERDALLAHGSAFILDDRLLKCSDKTTAYICTQCGSLLSPALTKSNTKFAAVSYEKSPEWYCLTCRDSDGSNKKDSIQEVVMPYVFKYLVAELAAMNIKINIDLKASLS